MSENENTARSFAERVFELLREGEEQGRSPSFVDVTIKDGDIVLHRGRVVFDPPEAPEHQNPPE